MFAEIVAGGVRIGKDFFLFVNENAFTKAITTDAAADVTDKQQCSGVIFVLEAGHYGVIFFTGRIERAPVFEFTGIRNDQFANGIVGVGPVDQREIVIICPEFKFVRDVR